MNFKCVNCCRELDPEVDNMLPVGEDEVICIACDEQEQIDLISDRLRERAEAAAK